MKAKELVLSCFLAVFQPRSQEPLGEWMAKNIVVRSTENPGKAGPYDPGYSPLVGKLFDEFLGSAEWEELHGQKSGQSAFSMHALGAIVRKVREAPGNTMYVIDSDKEAKNISARLQAFLEDSAATADIFEENEGDISTLTFRLPGMNLWLTGAGSAGSLANKTADLVVGDEIDKHKDLKGEATTIDLLRVRVKEQVGAKLLTFSTPTLASGQIHQEYLTGSQHKAHVPCPHCGHMQVLEWERVKFAHCKDLTGEWDLFRVRNETYYECCSCKGEIHDRDKRRMVARGEWRPTNFKTVAGEDGKDRLVPGWVPGKMSAHYSDLYSQAPNVNFGRLAVKFLAALRNPMKMRDFRQSHLGLPDEQTLAEVTEDKILALRGAYKRQQGSAAPGMIVLPGEEAKYDRGTPIPIKPLFCALLSDTQDANSKWTVQAFDRNGDLYVIDWGSCLELDDLDEVRARSVRWQTKDPETGLIAEQGEMPISVAMIDEGGHRSFEVRQFCYARFPECFSSRGAPGSVGSSVSVKDYRIMKTDDSPLIMVVCYDDNTFKRDLYIRQIARFDAEKAKAYGQSRLWLPHVLETEFTAELMKEKLERQKDGTYKWNKPQGNDWGDTVKMGRILFTYIAPEILRQEALERMEE